MAPKLPDRYETRIRLGRDGDVEEWLATDTSLDRPVLVRILESSATEQRRSEFIEYTKAAAAAHHVGLADVYAVGDEQNPYAVVEWHGGVSVADRLRAGETLSVAEFLSVGPRLASGLAELHETDGVHGAIDTGAIGFSGGQPAKLGGFGRRPRVEARREDTAALAAALRIAVTGTDIEGIKPSHVAEGLPHGVDSILAEAERGDMSASTLAASLRAQRLPDQPERRSTWTWRWTALSAGLVAAALIISAAGVAIEVDPESPFLFPAVPADGTPVAPAVGDSRGAAAASRTLTAEAVGYDPSGDPFPNVEDLTMVLDGARSTVWRSDSFGGPLPQFKPGIGISFTVAGTPRFMEVAATPGTGFSVLWAAANPETVDGWEHVFSGTTLESASLVRLPEREEGRWLLWITSLPEGDEARFYTEVGSVSFLP